jgi:uncharacterized protein YdhG (YjbR/CyaY superfamily)
MEKSVKKINTVEEYIALSPKEMQANLKKLRRVIREAAPEAQEIISYNMPAYKIYGRILLYFAAHKEHIGLYAMPSANIEFKKELKGYETSKGGIRFPFEKPIPIDLIKKMIKFRINENLKKSNLKK